jgi:hypothetical protein
MIEVELDGRELMTARDIMRICRVGKTTAYEIMAAIPETIRIPGGLRVYRMDLDRYLRRNRRSHASNSA